MTSTAPDFAAALALVGSLYDSGDLSHDQANPIIEALEAAIALQGDYNGLCHLYEQAQALRYLMRAVAEARPAQHDAAVARADRQWRVVRDILGQLALDEAHPGRAGGKAVAV